MDRLRQTALDWLRCRQRAVLVEVLQVQGSAPREAGTRMLVSAVQCAGTIGGGHLELKAIESAREQLRRPDGAMAAWQAHYPLGPALGQCCGGAVTLEFRVLDAQALARWPSVPPRFHLQLYGAGHVGRAIVQALAPLNVSVDWIDEREDEFPPAELIPAHTRRVCVDAVEAEVDQAPPGAFYLVLTHRHDLDLLLTQTIARRGDFGYLGLIGSATKWARFWRRMAAQGLSEDLLARITCPIGVPGIEGKEPEVIAVAVVAQLLQQPACALVDAARALEARV